jgi:hypothetical protein
MFFRFIFALFAFTFLHAADYVFFSEETILKNLNSYTNAEKAAIAKDLSIVRSVCFDDATTSNAPLYIATAGAPGARKSTILERYLHQHPELSHSVYLDTAPRTLRFMVNTYVSQTQNYFEIASVNQYDELIKSAFEKWQEASNFITLSLLEEAFQKKLNIVHGTTSIHANVSGLLPAIHQAGYRIELLLCSCDDDLRMEALEHSSKEVHVYQGSLHDAIAQGKYFSERMALYFQYADKLSFYWSDELKQPEILAAVLDGKNFVVTDFNAYIKFVGKYELDRKMHLADGTELPSFKELLASRTGQAE